jgi:hypothetical protein
VDVCVQRKLPIPTSLMCSQFKSNFSTVLKCVIALQTMVHRGVVSAADLHERRLPEKHLQNCRGALSCSRWSSGTAGDRAVPTLSSLHCLTTVVLQSHFQKSTKAGYVEVRHASHQLGEVALDCRRLLLILVGEAEGAESLSPRSLLGRNAERIEVDTREPDWAHTQTVSSLGIFEAPSSHLLPHHRRHSGEAGPRFVGALGTAAVPFQPPGRHVGQTCGLAAAEQHVPTVSWRDCECWCLEPRRSHQFRDQFVRRPQQQQAGGF